MALKTHSGGCHCGAVRFECDVDISNGTVKCNCSSCTKARSWIIFVGAKHYRLTAGEGDQATYQWTPPGRPGPSLKYHFCKTCGIRTPGSGDLEFLGGPFYAVQVSLLDGVDADELANAPIQYVDGRHDRFDRSPEDVRLL